MKWLVFDGIHSILWLENRASGANNKTFSMLVQFFSLYLFILVSFFCRGIVVQIHTFIMMVALFCIFVCFWLGSQHNRYFPCKCISTFWIGSFPIVFALLFHFFYHLRVYFARFHLCFLDFSHLCDVRSFDTHHFFAYLMRFPIYSAFFHKISQFILCKRNHSFK